MTPESRHVHGSSAWKLTDSQHGLLTATQLEGLGYGIEAVRHRVRVGRLHRIHRGVYSVGRPRLTDRGRWMAAVLALDAAILSHLDAAALWGLVSRPPGRVIEVTVLGGGGRARRRGLLVHRRREGLLAPPRTLDNIPVTDPADTVIDIAPRLTAAGLERAINQADKVGPADPERLRQRAAANLNRPGATLVRDLIDRGTFVLTDSDLEVLFVPLARAAGLTVPLTGVHLNGFKVDFYWPDLGLVVETDGGAFHRTPFQQTKDRRRDQAHTVAGLTPLRFTHAQVRYEPDEVTRIMRMTGARLRAQSSSNRTAAPGRAS